MAALVFSGPAKRSQVAFRPASNLVILPQDVHLSVCTGQLKVC